MINSDKEAYEDMIAYCLQKLNILNEKDSCVQKIAKIHSELQINEKMLSDICSAITNVDKYRSTTNVNQGYDRVRIELILSLPEHVRLFSFLNKKHISI